MSFAFDIDIPHGADEQEIRRRVRDFVDHFGGNGRILASIMTDFTDPRQTDIARDELYHYSLEYYNRLYHRNSDHCFVQWLRVFCCGAWLSSRGRIRPGTSVQVNRDCKL